MSGGAHHIPVNGNGIPAQLKDGVSTSSSNPNGTHTEFKLGPFAVDEDRRMRVVVIGAGFCGIVAGIRLAQRIPNVDLVIYEKTAGVGGTWLVNKYPGLACDIPSHCYQISFEPNPYWSSFYAPGPEILAYLEGVVDKYKLMKYIRLEHEIKRAVWDSKAGKWNLTVSTADGGEIKDAADFVINSTGGLSRWKWPEIDGLFDFKGRVVHSAEWDLQTEAGKEAWTGKKVAVIGVGSSALQIVPGVQPKASHVANFVRGRTWISAPFATREIQERNPGGENHYFTEAEHREFEDKQYYSEFRHKLEEELNAVHGATIRGHPLQLGAVKAFREAMIKKLEKKPWIADHIIPDFPVACRRLTPGPGYLEALTQDNVEFVTDGIKRVNQTGIETIDGKQRDFDIIVCATGFDTSWKPRYPIIGRDGINLRDKWDPHPVTYLTMATDGFPNWFTSLGPNSAIGSGSLLIILEKEIDYATTVIAKLQRERIKSIEVKKEAVQDFDEYLEHYFPQTVYSEKCRSWYKMGKEEGRVVGLWPGSCLHALRALAHPRWEDYNYEPLDDHPGSHNRFHWLGNGWTVNERDESGDRAWYMNEIDFPPVPS